MINGTRRGVRGQRHAPASLYPRKRAGTHCTGGWVGPRAGLDMCGKSRPFTGIRSPERPARSQSLYRLSYSARTKAISTKYSECVCSLSYTARKAHTPYYVIRDQFQLYHIFPHYLINGTIFGRNVLSRKCVF